MNKQAVIRRRLAISEAFSRNVHEKEPDPHKGVGDWEAFAILSLENWTPHIIDELPSESQDVPLDKRWGPHHSFSHRLLTSYIFAATTSIDPHEASIEEELARLTDRWHEETDFLSSPARITGNDTYLGIISFGKRAIPLILEDLKERGGDWYRALRILSREDPVPMEARGDVDQMKRAWLQWGRERGYIE